MVRETRSPQPGRARAPLPLKGLHPASPRPLHRPVRCLQRFQNRVLRLLNLPTHATATQDRHWPDRSAASNQQLIYRIPSLTKPLRTETCHETLRHTRRSGSPVCRNIRSEMGIVASVSSPAAGKNAQRSAPSATARSRRLANAAWGQPGSVAVPGHPATCRSTRRASAEMNSAESLTQPR